MSNTTYYQRNWDLILNRAKDYYENDRENMEETDTIICLEEEKQKLKEYQHNYRETKKI